MPKHRGEDPVGDKGKRTRLQFMRRLGIHAIKLMLVLGALAAKHPGSRAKGGTMACVLDSR